MLIGTHSKSSKLNIALAEAGPVPPQNYRPQLMCNAMHSYRYLSLVIIMKCLKKSSVVFREIAGTGMKQSIELEPQCIGRPETG